MSKIQVGPNEYITSGEGLGQRGSLPVPCFGSYLFMSVSMTTLTVVTFCVHLCLQA